MLLRKQLLILVLLFCTASSYTQNLTGFADYDYIKRLDIRLDIDKKYDLPETIKSTMRLKFMEGKSIFKRIDEKEIIDDNNELKYYYLEPKIELFIDRKSGIKYKNIDFYGKKYLIKSRFKPVKWQKTTEVKKIGDYFCQLAIYQDSTTVINAWFTTRIPVGYGPDKYGDLPGLIVLLIIDEGKIIFKLKDIKIAKIPEIFPPDKSKSISLEEYNKIKNKKLNGKDGLIYYGVKE